MKHVLLSALAVAVITVACNSEKTDPTAFTLTGITTNVPDSTLIFLENTETKYSDSAYILGNQFSFSGEIDGEAEQFILLAQELRQYKFIWLEPGKIVVDATNVDLRDATVTGSETQDISHAYDQYISEFDQEETRLSQEYIQNKNDGTLSNDDEMVYYDNMEDLRKKRAVKEQEFITDHPDSEVSTNALNIYASSWGKETAQELYSKLSTEQQNSVKGQEIKTFIELNVNPEVGDPLADFTMINTTGEEVTLSDYQGKLVLLEFWASWCAPCREENPELKATYDTYHSKGFEILAVSLDQSKEAWLKAIEQDQLPWGHVSDLKGDKNKAALIYGIAGIPDNFLIGTDGTIIARDLRGDALPKKLEEVLS